MLRIFYPIEDCVASTLNGSTCFFILQNKKSYLGEEVNAGLKGLAWNVILVLAILVVAAGAVAKVLSV